MTLDAVAKRARVSTATVSRVLNNLSVVKESTRKRVLEAVEELNYHPNLHARSLAGGRTRTLGMIVSNISNPFFIDIFRGMEATAREHEFEVLVEHTDYRADRLLSSVRSMIGRRVAGLALIVSEMEKSLMKELLTSDIPVVFYDVGRPGPNITNIRVRYEVGMHRVVQYLYSIGHRKMAFIGHHAALAPLQVRKNAFSDAVKQYGGEVESRMALSADTPAGGMQAARELLSSSFRPTAVVCVNDYMAVGAMREFRSAGISIPSGISVTGFDNIEFSEFTNPALTTVNIPRQSIGEIAVRALLEAESPTEIIIEPELVVRDSTGAALAQTA